MKSNSKSKLRSYLFWVLIGGLGAHRFYLRRKRSGFILLGYTVLTVAIDVFAVDIFPSASFFYGDTFYWMTTIPLGIFLIWDAFQIPKWVDEINYENNGASVFS